MSEVGPAPATSAAPRHFMGSSAALAAPGLILDDSCARGHNTALGMSARIAKPEILPNSFPTYTVLLVDLVDWTTIA